MKIEDQILELLKTTTTPLSESEISAKLEIKATEAVQTIKKLEQDKLIIEVGSNIKDENRKRRYYIAVTKAVTTHADLVTMNTTIATYSADSKDLFAELSEKVSRAEEQFSKIYINIISILGVFVAIFSLIIVNTSVISNFHAKCQGDLLVTLGAVNLSLIIALTCLLLLINLFVVRPLKNK